MWEDETRSHSEALTQTGQKTPQPLGSCQPEQNLGQALSHLGCPWGGSGAQC